MMFVFPMVGLSSRFSAAGYERPKYELDLGGETVFAHAVRSFERYFRDTPFVFMVRRDFGADTFAKRELARLGVRDVTIIPFDHNTGGQAETVFLGLREVERDRPVYIFNIDTFRPGFEKPTLAESCDGYLEVFRGAGEHWSFVEASADGRVVRTTEKDRISDLCCDGLYYFRRKGDFDDAYLSARAAEDAVKGEFYVAPLYNRLIRQGADIRFDLVPADVIGFCGTPDEYEALLAAGRGG